MKDAKETKVIELKKPPIHEATIFIEGDGDLVLNKMHARNERALNTVDRKKVRETPNRWEDVITAIHWRDGIPVADTYKDCTEELLGQMLENNAPCITAFGLKKSFGQAVVRNEIDKYSTKFDACMNIVADHGLIPIEFESYYIDNRLMSPKKGSPVCVSMSHFCKWKAQFDIRYSDNVFSLESIVSIIDQAGFSLGIGSGRTSNYGRYHVSGVIQKG